MSGKLRNNLIGQTFDYLTVLHRSENRGNGKKPEVIWECQCLCGKIVTVKGYSLISGHTKSCGCRKIKHGLTHKERLYTTWCNMRRRCTDPSNKRWEQYGGKGITICPEWNDYSQFREWAINNGYAENLTIDRIDINGNYCPENCRWADAKTQANNCSRNHIIEFNKKKMTMSEFADYLGLSYSALQHRIERNWDIKRIVSQPQRKAAAR